jgi:hypothetical protein
LPSCKLVFSLQHKSLVVLLVVVKEGVSTYSFVKDSWLYGRVTTRAQFSAVGEPWLWSFLQVFQDATWHRQAGRGDLGDQVCMNTQSSLGVVWWVVAGISSCSLYPNVLLWSHLAVSLWNDTKLKLAFAKSPKEEKSNSISPLKIVFTTC